ncbi:MAG: TolB family protein, partial [Pyrinomonadaceae bacterium]
SATVPPGRSQTLTFTGVADFGNNVTQPVVAMNGPYRWFNPGVDVRAGAAAQAMTLNILGAGARDLAASLPMWRYDGAQVGYAMGCGGVWVLPAGAAPGYGVGSQLPATKSGACGWGWGPTQTLADQVILAGGLGDKGLYLASAGSGARVKLLDYEGTLFELRWHPSGSNFLFVESEGSSGSSLKRYDFAPKKVSVLKAFGDKTVRGLSISPDGEWVVLEFGKTLEESVLSLVVTQKTIPELWVMRLDGSGLRPLVKNGQAPSWGVTPN